MAAEAARYANLFLNRPSAPTTPKTVATTLKGVND
jgi:hypothetical protein